MLLERGDVPSRPGVDSVGRRDMLFVGLGGVRGETGRRDGVWYCRFLDVGVRRSFLGVNMVDR